MEKDNKFLKGVLSGFCIMLVCSGILLFIEGEIRKRTNDLPETKTTVTSEGGSHVLNMDDQQIDTKIRNIEAVINQHFYDEVDPEKIESSMYKGLVAGLGDPYAAYYTEEELQHLNEATAGEYKGIGASLSQDRETGLVTIIRCFKGTPSEEAGLLPGDIIYQLNDTLVVGMELQEVVRMIKTEPGETIKITVVREGAADYMEFDVSRRKVEIPTVSFEMLENKIGYIEITEFDTVTEAQFDKALNDLEHEGMERLIIDLRNNPGGVLQTVCAMLNRMLPEGLIVYTEDKYGERSEFKSDGRHEFKKPLVLLVNGNSASASEIFAGAVKDYGIGTLVGTTTYGKGIVQRIVNLDDGTAVKLTIAKYFTPKGNDIHGKGIVPDVEIDLQEELKQKAVIEKSEDNQLQKAIEVLSAQ